MTEGRKKSLALYFLNALLFAVLYFVDRGVSPLIKISSATPFLILSLLIAFCMFSGEWTAAVSGIILGIFADSDASTGSFFNTVCFVIIALFVAVMLHYMFNNNIRCAIAVGLIGSAFYFGLKWLIFFAFKNTLKQSFSYLLYTLLPSALITAVFVIPFYYLEKYLFKKFS